MQDEGLDAAAFEVQHSACPTDLTKLTFVQTSTSRQQSCLDPGDQAMDSAMDSANVLGTLHHSVAKQDHVPPDTKQNMLVYPVVILLGCVLLLRWRKQTSFNYNWSRRRNSVSRYDV